VGREAALVNPILEQIKFMNKIVGLGKLRKIRKKHSLGLKFVRGYVATNCMWTLMNAGLLDELLEKETVELDEFARRRGLDAEVLSVVCEYLDGIKVLNFENGRCMLEPKGAALLEEPRGLFELLYGYEPVFCRLGEMIHSTKVYGKDFTRRGTAVAKGSGELGRQMPFLAVRELVFSHGFGRVLDLGCGDLEFLFLLCEKPDILCFGIDNDAETVEYARKRLSDAGLEERVKVARGDMFEVEMLAREYSDIDAITAIDVFHEYLSEGPEKVVELLRALKEHLPATHLVVAEFFKIPRAWLRRIPTTTLEHHLFHALTNQEILPIGQWIEMFEQAGYGIVEKKLLHAIGHGYFVLK
jgi:SAM-dependent methyltransferase